MSLATVYITVPNHAEGERLARELLERRLIACANLLPGVKSFYRWEGRVQSDPEEVLVCKTQMRIAHRVIEVVTELHPYDVPCVTVMPVLKVQPEYGRWVVDETTPAAGEDVI